jgi:predicted DCC family thiol-disulfide oxidoreductase YuxK
VNTEITDNNNAQSWIFFDTQCQLCVTLARRLTPLLHRYHFALAPLQGSWVREKLGLSEEDLLSEMRLLTSNGLLYGGADALLAIAKCIWWAKPFYWFGRLPLIKSALRRAYAWVARRRYCFGARCGPDQTSSGLQDLQCCRSGRCSQKKHRTRVFFELP